MMAYTFREYQKDALRTAAPYTAGRIFIDVLGLASEAGELAGELQHAVEQKRGASQEHIVEELGDILWRVADICSDLGLDLGLVAEDNIAKLRLRHPNGFTAESSRARSDKNGDESSES
jgi:NTP pyrophosphatase (non-canonical NTP hydrolase)